MPITDFITICEHHKQKTDGGNGKIIFLNLQHTTDIQNTRGQGF